MNLTPLTRLALGGSSSPPVSGSLTARADGVFRQQDGSVFQWRGCTDFLLYKRYLDGEDIAPILRERAGLGANILRVLGMVNSFAHFWPNEHPNYYFDLEPFGNLLASYGLRLEFVVFADAQIIMPDLGDEIRHLNAVVAMIQACPTAVLEVCNEPFANLPGGDAAARNLALGVQGRGVLIASGAYTDWPPLQPADYGTHHADRNDEWPRKGKDTRDLWEVTHVPWVSDEPMGAAETNQPGRRSNVPSDFAYFAATAALEGAGATFHSDDGILSQPLGPIQRQCAQAFFDAMKWVPAEAPTWPYQRGDQGSEAGIGNMPILHDDALELRSFCKGGMLYEWCVQIRTSRQQPTPRDGWQVTETPRQGFVKLGR